MILGLSDYAKNRGEDTGDGVLVDVTVDELSEYVGLEPTVTRNALRAVEALELITILGERPILVRDVDKMQEFLSYLELKEKYGD